MPLKRAQEFIEYLVREVRVPRGTAISLTEATPKSTEDTNWTTGIDEPLTREVMARYVRALARLRGQHPRIDWSGVTEFDGERRRIARWLSEV
jgi:hypothetical protein